MKSSCNTLFDVKELATDLIDEGFLSNDEIVEEIEQSIDEGYCEKASRRAVKMAVGQAAREHQLKESQWVGETDNEKLDRAFEALEKEGILARHDYWCCQSCGRHALINEAKELSENRKIDGYVFYHAQDTSSVRYDKTLWLAFGSLADELLQNVCVGIRIVDALKAAGLNPQWNCDFRTRIRLEGFEWHRRRQSIAS